MKYANEECKRWKKQGINNKIREIRKQTIKMKHGNLKK
jgi:hypothetical protein